MAPRLIFLVLLFISTTVLSQDDTLSEINELHSILDKALESNDAEEIAMAYYELSYYHSDYQDYQSSIDNFTLADKYFKRIDNIEKSGICQFNMGNAYLLLDEYVPAMISFQKALIVFDSLDYQLGLVAVNEGLGRAHDVQDEYDKSISYFTKAIELNKELKDTLWFANIYNNLAIVSIRQIEEKYVGRFGDFWQDTILADKYKVLQDAFADVVSYADSSILYNTLIDKREGVAQARTTRNQITLNKGDFYAALEEYEFILTEYSDALWDYEIAVIKNNMAHCYMRIGQYATSQILLEESKKISDELSSKELKMHYYLKASDLNSYRGKYKNALLDFKTYVVYKDSIFNEEKLDAIKDAEVKYETKSKEQEIVSLNRENLLKKRQLRYLIAGILLVSILFFIAIYFWNLTRRKNAQIREQKKEIDDSIQVAKDIQFAVIPSPTSLKNTLHDFFILFRPRDEVSGDFYWIAEENNKTYVLTADSTGHGVPGAFVSMMGVALIREMVALHPEANAGILLDKLRAKLIESLQQSGQEKEVSYGMDVSLCILNKKMTKLDFAGANNPLYVLRDGEIKSYNADKMPIGIHPNSDNPFTNHIINLKKGDSLYTFSDGYMDQFGGPKGKKFMRKRFQNLLTSSSHMEMDEISKKLNLELDQWQGEQDQVDDILVIGIRV